MNSDKNKLSETIPSVDSTYQSIREILGKARSVVYRSINFTMVLTYWNIGNVIVDDEQHGKERAEYGKALIKELSLRVTKEYGKGFDESNLRNICKFYLTFPNCDALRHELTWTHYRLLLKIKKEYVRNFYMLETVDNNWSTRELERQIDSLLYERIALSKNKDKVKELSTEGHVVQKHLQRKKHQPPQHPRPAPTKTYHRKTGRIRPRHNHRKYNIMKRWHPTYTITPATATAAALMQIETDRTVVEQTPLPLAVREELRRRARDLAATKADFG